MDKEKLTSQFQQIVAVVGVDCDIHRDFARGWSVNTPGTSMFFDSHNYETFQHFIEALRKEVKRIESTQIVL